jgi:hypothetical protein
MLSHAHTGTARIGPLPHTARRHKRREGRAVGRDAHECKYMLPALPLYPLLYLRGPASVRPLHLLSVSPPWALATPAVGSAACCAWGCASGS